MPGFLSRIFKGEAAPASERPKEAPKPAPKGPEGGWTPSGVQLLEENEPGPFEAAGTMEMEAPTAKEVSEYQGRPPQEKPGEVVELAEVKQQKLEAQLAKLNAERKKAEADLARSQKNYEQADAGYKAAQSGNQDAAEGARQFRQLAQAELDRDTKILDTKDDEIAKVNAQLEDLAA